MTALPTFQSFTGEERQRGADYWSFLRTKNENDEREVTGNIFCIIFSKLKKLFLSFNSTLLPSPLGGLPLVTSFSVSLSLSRKSYPASAISMNILNVVGSSLQLMMSTKNIDHFLGQSVVRQGKKMLWMVYNSQKLILLTSGQDRSIYVRKMVSSSSIFHCSRFSNFIPFPCRRNFRKSQTHMNTYFHLFSPRWNPLLPYNYLEAVKKKAEGE